MENRGSDTIMGRAELRQRLPYGDAFLFLDEARLEPASAVGRYRIPRQAEWLDAHFPERPIFPASLMVEALGQLGVFYLLAGGQGHHVDPASIRFIKSEDVACRRECLPGELLELRIRASMRREPLIVFKGSATVGGELALKASAITLSFSTAAAVGSGPPIS